MERHGGLSPRDRLEVESALDLAFEPLRSAAADVHPRYVRAAVRWGRPAERAPLPWVGVVRRLSEVSVAAAMTLAVFSTAFGGPQPVVEWPAEDSMRQAQREAIRQIEATRIVERVEFAALRDWLDPTVVMREATARRPRIAAPVPPTDALATGPF